MSRTGGGTSKWCPKCKAIRKCAAISPAKLGEISTQRLYWDDDEHADVRWFRRGQVCRTCGDQWLSAELPEDFVNELVELRDALGDIKQKAEFYAHESAVAAVALNELSESLRVLKALKIYENTEAEK
jgi:hypothetical protein